MNYLQINNGWHNPHAQCNGGLRCACFAVIMPLTSSCRRSSYWIERTGVDRSTLTTVTTPTPFLTCCSTSTSTPYAPTWRGSPATWPAPPGEANLGTPRTVTSSGPLRPHTIHSGTLHFNADGNVTTVNETGEERCYCYSFCAPLDDQQGEWTLTVTKMEGTLRALIPSNE